MLHDPIRSRTVQITKDNVNMILHPSRLRREVWVIQVYTDTDWLSSHVAPIWEDTADALADVVQFGRINADVDTAVVKKLPIKPRLYPTILLMSYHMMRPLMYQGVYDITAAKLKSWVTAHFPTCYPIYHASRPAQDFLHLLPPPNTLVISQQPLALRLRSRILRHADVLRFAVALGHEAKVLGGQLGCHHPEKDTCLILVPSVRVRNHLAPDR